MSGVTLKFAMRMAKSVAASASWMNRAIFLISFFSAQWSGSKSRTSPAIVQSKPAVSKCVIERTPLFPARRFFQTSSVPIPSPQTNPTPVTTTRRLTFATLPNFFSAAGELLFGRGVFLDVLDGVLHRGDFLGVLVRDFDPKGLFKGHHTFNRI